MADKKEDNQSVEEQIENAKNMYQMGCRNFLGQMYPAAVSQLGEACEKFEAVHGHMADELGLPYLMYAKALIAVAQEGENKIIDVPDEEEENDDEDDEDEEGEEEEDGDKEKQETEKQSTSENDTTGKNITNGSDTNGTSNDPQPGTSAVVTEEDDAGSDTIGNLQLAWEILELAVKIFIRQGEPALPNLAEAYFELAEISFEDSHFDTAITDYKNSESIRMKLPLDDLQMLSLIQYKIGLCYCSKELYKESVEAFKKACDIIDCRAEAMNNKEEKSEKDAANLEELKQTKDEILLKITEIEETMQSDESVKDMMKKLLNDDIPTSSASTSTGESSKAMPSNISHLIKRKKPDSPDECTSSVAKKPSI